LRKKESGPSTNQNGKPTEEHHSEWPLLGKTIDHFLVIDFIGKGGMGEVYVGYDEKLQRKVALKSLRGRHAAVPGRESVSTRKKYRGV
jgi:serine/threonine protein kinase